MPTPAEKPRLTVVVAVRDEQEMLPGCLASVSFADEVVVVDDRTTDSSAAIAAAWGARVLAVTFEDFASLRRAGLDAARGAWTLVLDADERVPRPLALEVRAVTAGPPESIAFAIGVSNVFYGQPMQHGGWTSEAPVRLFPSGCGRFVGAVHEHLELDAAVTVETLSGRLVHLSHRSVAHALAKAAPYADLAGSRLFAAGAPPVTTARMLSVAGYHLARRLVWKRGWRDGVPGVYEVFRTTAEHLAGQMRLWELQRGVEASAIYAALDEEMELLSDDRPGAGSDRPRSSGPAGEADSPS